MSKTSLAILLFLAFYTTLAQPGLPACWLQADPCANHPHFNRNPYAEHDHEYLRLQALSLANVVLPTSLVPASLLIQFLGWTNITRMTTRLILSSKSWGLPPDPPPPRASFSS